MPLEQSAPIAADVPLALRALVAGPLHFSIGAALLFPERSTGDVAAALRDRHLAFVRNTRIVGLSDYLRANPRVLDEEAARERVQSRIFIPG
jgi:hypothetical protein